MASAQKPALLLIDDDLISREVLALTLGMHGYPIESAEDGAHALQHLASNSTGVILMDSQMPGLSGVELVAALRAASPARIVAISASPISPELKACTDGFLLKPLTPEALDGFLAANPVQQASAEAPSKQVGSLIDPATLAKLQAMMKPASLRELYQAVANDLGPRLASLEAAMTAGDAAEVSRIAHAIKGGCAMVGLTSIRATTAVLEAGTNPVTWPELLEKIKSDLHDLNVILMMNFPDQH